MNKLKNATHILAAVGAAIAGFIVSPAGVAVIHQYPKLAAIGPVLAAVALYFNPKTQ